jgi:hypothetical protein
MGLWVRELAGQKAHEADASGRIIELVDLEGLAARRVVSRAEHDLLSAIKHRLAEIDGLAEWIAQVEEDGVYRYYHQSFKVYSLQIAIKKALSLFESIAPEGTWLNDWFLAICQTALEHEFSVLDRTWDWDRMNQNWHAETRPILEGFWHCSYFVRMLARYGRELDEAAGGAALRVGCGALPVRPSLSRTTGSGILTAVSRSGSRRAAR